MNAVAEKLGGGTGETVRKRVRQAEVDGGVRPGRTTEESEELRRLRRVTAELKRANEILKAASAVLERGVAAVSAAILQPVLRRYAWTQFSE
jgi:transposase-like protein